MREFTKRPFGLRLQQLPVDAVRTGIVAIHGAAGIFDIERLGPRIIADGVHGAGLERSPPDARHGTASFPLEWPAIPAGSATRSVLQIRLYPNRLLLP